MGSNIVMGRGRIRQGKQDQTTDFGTSGKAHDPYGDLSNVENAGLQVTSCEQGFERAWRQESRCLSESEAEEGTALSKEFPWEFCSWTPEKTILADSLCIYWLGCA